MSTIIKHELILAPTTKSIPFPPYLQDKLDGMELRFQDPPDTDESDKLPMPWDAGFKVDAENLVIEGGAGPSGWGSASVSIPLELCQAGKSPILIHVNYGGAQAPADFLNYHDVGEIFQAGWEVYKEENGDIVPFTIPSETGEEDNNARVTKLSHVVKAIYHGQLANVLDAKLDNSHDVNAAIEVSRQLTQALLSLRNATQQ